MRKKISHIRIVPILDHSNLHWVVKDGQTVLGKFISRDHADKHKMLIESKQNNLFNTK